MRLNTLAAIAAELLRRGRGICGLPVRKSRHWRRAHRHHRCPWFAGNYRRPQCADPDQEYDAGGEEHVPTLGIPDEEFAATRKLITREEVRVVTLAKLKLRHDMVLWDIGAGSGSVSVEADHLLPNGRIFAVERNPQCINFIKENFRELTSGCGSPGGRGSARLSGENMARS
ncbi:MAG: precorrin-6Y C5,15-methyltransferase (decarboxylating) subunit CbiT [Syntrophotaleaceae bacterium]